MSAVPQGRCLCALPNHRSLPASASRSMAAHARPSPGCAPLAVPCKLQAEERVLAVMTTGMHNNSPFSSSAAALLRNITKCDRADCSQEGFCKVAAGNAAPACNGLHSANMYSWCACFENRLCRMARLQLDSTSFCLQFYCLTQTLEPQAHQMTNIQGVVLLCEAGCNATVGKHNAFRIPLLIACIPRL